MILSNKKLANPFVYQGYESPEYFCDREAETKTLLSHLKNGRNITKVSDLGRVGWRPNKHIAQGKRSDTLGMNTNNIPINALKEQKRNIY